MTIDAGGPLILYVPGLLPKPDPATHRAALLRCLLEGIRRRDASIAAAIETRGHSFDLVSWTFDFYGEHRNFSLDADAVEALLLQPGPTDADIERATSWLRSLTRWLYRLGDRLPFLIPHLASERMELHLRDLRRYTLDQNGIGEHARAMLKVSLKAAAQRARPILLIGHSMGSVIAYDALWQLSHCDDEDLQVDLLLTMGSPLGQRYIQRRLKGHAETVARRYPTNIRRWVNLSAIGDLTAIDPTLADDFREMRDLSLVDAIVDYPLYNYFRLDGELNVHSEYGYLVNDSTASIVIDWWQRVVPGTNR